MRKQPNGVREVQRYFWSRRYELIRRGPDSDHPYAVEAAVVRNFMEREWGHLPIASRVEEAKDFIDWCVARREQVVRSARTFDDLLSYYGDYATFARRPA